MIVAQLFSEKCAKDARGLERTPFPDHEVLFSLCLI